MTCQHCGATVYKVRLARFCGAACRAAWHRTAKAAALDIRLSAALEALGAAVSELQAALRASRKVSP